MGAGRVCRGGPSSASPPPVPPRGGVPEARHVLLQPPVPRPPPRLGSTSVTKTVNGAHHFKIAGYSLSKGIGIKKFIAFESFNAGMALATSRYVGEAWEGVRVEGLGVDMGRSRSHKPLIKTKN
ncbi:unnamed protein product [Miscanthus lutarioriparius]|uniref:Uncharacterized protein n=1 Tax=Miscanthus lutarioriparius TaxID=422564 RepID=A0A811NGN2_9POAL|nr:unnamed protein product [Miscanthus lutarioriparius]